MYSICMYGHTACSPLPGRAPKAVIYREMMTLAKSGHQLMSHKARWGWGRRLISVALGVIQAPRQPARRVTEAFTSLLTAHNREVFFSFHTIQKAHSLFFLLTSVFSSYFVTSSNTIFHLFSFPSSQFLFPRELFRLSQSVSFSHFFPHLLLFLSPRVVIFPGGVIKFLLY